MKAFLISLLVSLSLFSKAQEALTLSLQNEKVSNAWNSKISNFLSTNKEVTENKKMSQYALKRAKYFSTLLAHTSQKSGKSFRELVLCIPEDRRAHTRFMGLPEIFSEPDTLKFSPGTKHGNFGNEYIKISAEIMVNTCTSFYSDKKLTQEEAVQKFIEKMGGSKEVSDNIFESYKNSPAHYSIMNKSKSRTKYGSATTFSINQNFSKEKNKWFYQVLMINVTNFGDVLP
jgi:hypothetical protein